MKNILVCGSVRSGTTAFAYFFNNKITLNTDSLSFIILLTFIKK